MNTFHSVRSMVATLYYLMGTDKAPTEGRSEWPTILDAGL